MSQLEETRPAAASRSRARRVMLFAVACLISLTVVFWMLQRGEMPRERVYMLGIFVLAALLWVTEALPLFATALVVIALQVILLANPAQWAGLGFEVGTGPTYQSILAAALDPVIVLFFGGFLLAQAAVKEGVDSAMASLILRPFGARPATVLLGVMLVTALFSMWMSNTATAAMMITLVVPMLFAVPSGDPFRKAMMLAVPFAANIGGMGTPIGTPPNAVAIGFLRKSGIPFSFVDWMLIAVPLMVVLLLITWLLLLLMYPARSTGLKLVAERKPLTGRSMYVVFVFVVTVLLWLSEGWHGLPASVVALLPAVAFTAPGLLTHADVNRLDWNILILIAGGISLGAGVQMTGLDTTLVALLTRGSPNFTWTVLAIMILWALLLSTFMSNTAAANLLLPIGISFAVSMRAATNLPAIQAGISIALMASVAMALPISTPPNAIAYARGELTTRDMAIPGTIIGLIAGALIVALGGMALRFWGMG
jgi:solute carrier family 13 (sodium-dependent dicarboxylate transporter), member 2/3/5